MYASCGGVFVRKRRSSDPRPMGAGAWAGFVTNNGKIYSIHHHLLEVIFAGPPMRASLSTSIVRYPFFMSFMGLYPGARLTQLGEQTLKPSLQLSTLLLKRDAEL